MDIYKTQLSVRNVGESHNWAEAHGNGSKVTLEFRRKVNRGIEFKIYR